MTGPVFVDTNVLVYRHDSSDPAKQSRAEDWYSYLWRSHSGRLSVQDLQRGQTFGEVRVIDPFASAERTPEEVLQALEAGRP